jgi:DGQHR domain-containing protein
MSKMKVLGVLSPIEAIAQISPPEMKELFFISRFEETDPDSPAPDKHGYQRQPIESRIPGIAKYFAEPGARITPINLSIRVPDADVADFLKLWDKSDIIGIHQRWRNCAVSVVDGQHRYLGIVRHWEQDPEFLPKVPVVLNFGMTFAEEAEFFDVINSTQKKLPKALIEITKADVTELGDMGHPQRIRLIATMLARHDDSVWKGQVNLTGARDPNKPVTFEGLRRSSVSMFPKEILDRLDTRGLDADQIARDYWRTVAAACPDAWNAVPGIEPDENGDDVEVPRSYRIKELVGVASLARLGKDIIASALEHDDFNTKMIMLTGRLNDVDWEKRKGNEWMASQAGFAGQADLYTVLYRWLYLSKLPLDD